MARSMCAEMHSGFQNLRRKHSMNVRQVYPPGEIDDDVIVDVERIMELWAQARARYGGEGDFLFGAFGAADIMYAPGRHPLRDLFHPRRPLCHSLYASDHVAPLHARLDRRRAGRRMGDREV